MIEKLNNNQPKFAGTQFSWKNNVKYLEVHLDRSLNFHHHTKETLKSANRIISILFCMLKKYNRVRLNVKCMIYSAYIRPIIAYAIPVFSNYPTVLKKLQVFQNKCLRMASNSEYETRNSYLHRICKMPTINSHKKFLREST